MLAYLVCNDQEQEKYAEIKQVLQEQQYRILHLGLTEFLETAEHEKRNSLFILSDRIFNIKSIDDLIQHIPKGSYIFYISDKLTPTDYKIISRSGVAEATDWISAPQDIKQYLKITSKTEQKALTPQDPDLKKIVISVLGAGGGSGCTTIAMELAIDLILRAKMNRYGRVALLDLDTEGGSVCDYLSLEPRLDLNEIAVNPRRLDSYMLEIMSSKHQSGLDIFSVSESYQHLKYKSQDSAVLSLLNCIVDNYSITLVDIPYRCAVNAIEVVRNSDLVFCIGIFSVPSAKRIKKLLTDLVDQGVSKDNATIILTDTDTNLVGGIAQRFNIESVFKGWSIYYIRRDRSFALECVDAGVSMVQTQPRKGICQDIHKITDYVSGIIEAPLHKL